ncbi:MAG: serine/threonine protein kinase, partial [Candidatus Wallbacteria bacterium]|nr:serine/threonine protein kinase [Candidatus Wallbacteria bacterium]
MNEAVPGAPGPAAALPEEWSVLGELGRGGMGVVYRARHRLTGQLAAVKAVVLERAGDPEYGRRFAQEVAVLTRLEHPRVVRLLQAGIHAGRPWLALELVEGPTLRERMAAGPISAGEAARLGSQIAEALEYTHAAGVVHRDLKPENV